MLASRHLFYIHGFNSSPQSTKARMLAAYLLANKLDIDYRVPELPYGPEQAMQALEASIVECLEQAKGAPVGLIGSSMGGFYGTYIAEKYALPLVLVNPAVKPYRLLKDYMGWNENIYTGEKYQFTEKNIDQLIQLDIDPVTNPDRYLLLTQEGDEVLDFREGVEKYHQSRQIVQAGGSHGFDGFETLIPEIIDFLFHTTD